MLQPSVIRAFLLLPLLGMIACSGPEERLARYVERGDEFFSERNYDKARVEFSNALQIDPQNAEVRYMLGQISERQNAPLDAVGHYQAAIDADTGHTGARAALGRLFLIGGLVDRALELVEPGLVAAPQDHGLLTVRGAARAQQGDTEAAMTDVRAALSSAPDDEYAIALLASLLRQAGKLEEAADAVKAGLDRLPDNIDLRVVLADLQVRLKDPDAAEKQLRKVTELQPEVTAHWQRLTRFYLVNGDTAAAEQALRDAVGLQPSSRDAKLALVDFLAAQKGSSDAEQQIAVFLKEDQDVDLKLAFGRFYEGRNNLDRAEALYREVVEKMEVRPAGLSARNRLAAIRVERNDFPAAEQLIGEILEQNPGDNEALVLRANLALARNDAVSAIGDLRVVLRDQPNAPTVMRALARAHMQNQEAALAEETLRTASEANPQDTATRLDLAGLLLSTGRLDQARPLLEKLVAEMPQDVRAAEGLFRVQAGQKDLAAARATATALQASRPDLALGYYFAAMLDEAERNPSAAIAAYEEALRRQPDSAEPLAALVRIDMSQNRPQHATERLDAVITQFPDNAVARNLKGEVLVAGGRFEEAQRVYAEAIDKAPRWWMPYRGLTLARLGNKDTDGAVAALRDGIAKTGGMPALANDLAALYERLGQFDNAINVYEDLLTRNPQTTIAANNLAMLLVSYRNDAASLDRARELAEGLSGSTDASYVNTRGWVRYKRGEYEEALPLLQQAVDQSPDSPVMRYHLGMAQLKLGNKESARQNLEQALDAKRTFAGIDEARSALKDAST